MYFKGFQPSYMFFLRPNSRFKTYMLSHRESLFFQQTFIESIDNQIRQARQKRSETTLNS